jgi:mRNA interferase RelE/StbE
MASYKITLKRSVEKDLRALSKKTILRVLKRIEQLKDDPRPRQSIKLTGAERLYRIRVGDYRVIYEIDDNEGQIAIIYVRHRRDAYRDF